MYYKSHTHVTHKWQSRCMVPDISSTTNKSFCHFGLFFALLPRKQSRKSKFWKNEKSSCRYYHLDKCTVIDNHMIYGFCDFNCNRQIFFVIFSHFLAFYAPNRPENENIKKLKKAPGDIIILHKCTKNHDHRLYCSWDMVCAGCNCYFSFLEISSYYTSVPKMMIIGYTVSEIWHRADVIVIFHFGLYFALFPP